MFKLDLHSVFRRTSREDLLSPVKHLLQSNSPPSDQELHAILQHLSALNSRPSSPRKADEEHFIAESIRAHTAILSPIRRLPFELLEFIFLNYDGHMGDHHTLRWRDLPWSLTHVCRRWREVALNVPTLWNRIPCVHGAKKTWRRTRVSAEVVVAELLRRSGDIPFTFSYSAPGLDLKKFDDAALDLLVAHSERWDTINIEMIAKSVVRIFGPLDGRMPKLRRLTLQLGSTEITWFINAFREAPSLTEVFLVDYITRNVALPWNQITVFREVTKNGTAIHMPESDGNPFPNLRILELTRYNSGQPTFLFQVLPQLTILRVRFGERSNAEAIIANLTLPSLEELAIYRWLESLSDPFINLITRSRIQNTLKTLSIDRGEPFRHHILFELPELLKVTPALEKLEVFGQIEPLHLEGFCPLNDSFAGYVPNLRLLHVSAQPFDPKFLRALYRITQTRYEGGIIPPPDNYDKPFVLGVGQFRRLETLRVSALPVDRMHSHAISLQSQAYLNNWMVRETDRNESLGLARTLCEEVPGLVGNIATTTPSIFSGTSESRARRLDEVFKRMERHDVAEKNERGQPYGLWVLYVSRLHLLVYNIATAVRAEELPNDDRYNFKERARILHERWEPFVEADAPNVRWVTPTNNRFSEIQYISSHHPFDTVPYRDIYARVTKIAVDHGEDYIPEYMKDMKALEDPNLPVIV